MSDVEKAALRLQMRQRLRALSADQVALASRAITVGVAALIPDGAVVGLFAGARGEPQLDPVGCAPHATWAWPRCTGPGTMHFHAATTVPRDKGMFGIPAPAADAPKVSPTSLDVVVVPGIAFTREGLRLGQGGGFYDRYLAGVRSDALLVGVCYSWQVVTALPTEAHDMTMTHVVTETEYWS